MLVAVAGPNGAGKGEVIRFLAERGFVVHSLSDAIRAVLAEQGLEESRERMIATGRALRSAGGPGALAHRLLAALAAGAAGLPPRLAVDSVRHPAEVEALRAAGEPFLLLWVDAAPELRLARLRERGRPGDPETLDELRRLEGYERGSEDPAAQQLDAVHGLADAVLLNEGDLEALHARLADLLEAA